MTGSLDAQAEGRINAIFKEYEAAVEYAAEQLAGEGLTLEQAGEGLTDAFTIADWTAYFDEDGNP